MKLFFENFVPDNVGKPRFTKSFEGIVYYFRMRTMRTSWPSWHAVH